MFYSILLIIIIILFLFNPRFLGLIFSGCLLAFFGLIGAIFSPIFSVIFSKIFGRNILNFSSKNPGAKFRANFNANFAGAGAGDWHLNHDEFALYYIELVSKIAKLDGRISTEEAAFISASLDSLASSPEHRNYLKKAYFAAKDSPKDYEKSAQKLCRLNPREKMRVLQSLLQLAMIDGLSESKMAALHCCARLWGLLAQFDALLQMLGLKASARGGSARVGLDKKQALKRLELGENASMDEIKSAYRRLARKYHPDALAARGLSEEDMKKSAEIFSQINEAYEYLKNSAK